MSPTYLLRVRNEAAEARIAVAGKSVLEKIFRKLRFSCLTP